MINEARLVVCYRSGVYCYCYYCYHVCQFDTGGRTQKARPAEVLTHSQMNLEVKGNLEQPIRLILLACQRSGFCHQKNVL